MSTPTPNHLQPSITSTDNIQGQLNAPARIAIFFDATDPACVVVHESIKNAVAQFGDDVAIIYRHYPQTTLRPMAYAASQSLEAAAQQDKFWEMFDAIVARQDRLSDGILRHCAVVIGLDKAKFEDDFHSNRTIEKIKQDVHSAKASGISGTPAIFVNSVHQSTLSLRFVHDLITSNGAG